MIGFSNLVRWFESSDRSLLELGMANTLVLITERDMVRLRKGEAVGVLIGDSGQAITIAHADVVLSDRGSS